ncbi:hypothetical protein Leryth_016591 [Lithospermum erythrorhizon]|nr:hypothetical protein Leryth_016591 [Lithospermum erythrorhizon]
MAYYRLNNLKINNLLLPFCLNNIIIPSNLQFSCYNLQGFSSCSASSKYSPARMAKMEMNGSEIIVNEPKLLQEKISAIRRDGPVKLQVIADFDATLTKYWIDGLRGQSSHNLLQQSNHEYDAKRQKLFDYYHPLEFNPSIPLSEKTKLMEEWYDFNFLEEKEVPVLIFSAGLADIIEEVLRQKLHRSFKNIRISTRPLIIYLRVLITNSYVLIKSGVTSVYMFMYLIGKTIHSLNKNEHALDMAAPLHEQLGGVNGVDDDSSSVRKRTNVLLLGDQVGDLGMSDGLNYETRISVGFLNCNIEKNLESYKTAFDVVYLNDAAMTGVLELASQLCPSSSE